ncbi:MAG TPA: papain-like cysteine protease family protein [Rhodanobacter sp.]
MASAYDVPLVFQQQNPICWMACLAMIDSYWTNSSVGIGKFSGGFDPSDSSIPNPGKDWPDFERRMKGFGFYPDDPGKPLTLAAVSSLLDECGPLAFIHTVTNGQPWKPAGGSGSHAVVITAADASTRMLRINNPWGTKDAWYGASVVLPCAVTPSSRYAIFYKTGGMSQ